MYCICMDSEHSPSLGVLSSSSSPFTSFSISPTCIYVQGVGQTQGMGSTQREWGKDEHRRAGTERGGVNTEGVGMGSTQRGWEWGQHRGGGDGVNTEGQVQRGGSTQRDRYREGWGQHRGGGDGVNTEGQVQRGVGSTQDRISTKHWEY